MNVSALSIRALGVALALSIFAFIVPQLAHAQAGTCDFSRTLYLGVEGADVLCLQTYLNSTDTPVAEIGVGSAGNETTTYGSLTEQAVLAWQKANGIAGANGNFGPSSQAKYDELTAGGSTDTSTAVSDEQAYLQGIVADLQAQVAAAQAAQDSETHDEPTPTVAGASTDAETRDNAQQTLKAVFSLLEDAHNQIDDVDELEEREELRADLGDVFEDLFSALRDYFDGEYGEAIEQAEDALDDASDVLEDAGGESNLEIAEDLLEDTEDLYDEVSELLEEAEDQDVDVNDAPKLLRQARGQLADAKDAFNKRIYRQTISDLHDAEETLEDARDEIELDTEDDVMRAIEDAWDQHRKVERDIDDADDGGEDVDEAEDLLDDAERRLIKADLALDDEEHVEAMEYVEEAEDLLEEAEDAIGGAGDREEAEDALDDAWDAYRDADDEVDEADDDGDDIGDARDYLDDAKDLLDDAEDEMDDKDYDKVLDLVDEIEDLIDDALDEL